MAIKTGDRVGDYRVIGFAGSGGMGTVYKIEHVITKRIEAMKLLPVGIGSDPEEVHRFEREIQVQARLHHPNIASLYNAVRDGHSIALIMEYVEGEPLQRKLERGRLPLHTAMNYTGQVLGALAYAHQNGVIHRDVTPANIIITPEGTAKLTDFGLARGVTDLRVTNAGVAVGSPWYMSPEQVRAVDEPDARTDIYSMGAVLYEMLTGRKLFEAEGSFALMCAQMEQVPKPPGTFNPAVPEALDHAIAKALAKDREARFQSAGEFRLALETAIADAPPAPAARISQPAPQPAQPQPARTAAAKQKAKALWAAARAALSGPASRLNRIRLPRAAMAAVAASATLTAILCGVALWPKPARVATKPAPAASAPAPIVPAAVTPAPAPPAEAPPIQAPPPAVPAVVNPVARTEPRQRPAAPARRRQPAPKGLMFSGAVERSPGETAQPNPSPEIPAASSEAPAPRPDASAAPEPPPAPPAAPSYAAPSAASEPAQQDPPAPAPADEKPRKGGHWFKRALDKINPFGKGDKASPGDAVKPPSKD